jgi:hypothetical protein
MNYGEGNGALKIPGERKRGKRGKGKRCQDPFRGLLIIRVGEEECSGKGS